MTAADRLEAAAQALHAADTGSLLDWPDLSETAREDYRRTARIVAVVYEPLLAQAETRADRAEAAANKETTMSTPELTDEDVSKLLAALDNFTPAAQLAIRAFAEDRRGRVECEAALRGALQAAVDAMHGARNMIAADYNRRARAVFDVQATGEEASDPLEADLDKAEARKDAVLDAIARAAALGVVPRSP